MKPAPKTLFVDHSVDDEHVASNTSKTELTPGNNKCSYVEGLHPISYNQEARVFETVVRGSTKVGNNIKGFSEGMGISQ